MPPSTADLRFGAELRLFQELTRSSAVLDAGSVGTHQLNLNRRELLGNATRLSEALVPDLYKLYQDCLKRVDSSLSGDLYMQQNSSYNASVAHVGKRFDIVLTSAIAKDFRPAELAFVIGHELGHVLFEHSRISVQRILGNPNGVPYELAQSLLRWSRACEISADRMGLLCSGTLGSAACTYFKLSSGLLINNEDIIIRTLREQFDEVQKLSSVKHLSREWSYTHPLMPIRFRSLELIAMDIIALRNGFQREIIWKKIDQEIETLLQSTEPLNENTLFRSREGASLLYLCLLFVAVADDRLHPAEMMFLEQTHRSINPTVDLGEVIRACREDPQRFREQALRDIGRMSIKQNEMLDLLELCFYMAQADREIVPTELAAMRRLAEVLHHSPSLIEQVQKDMVI